MPSRQPRKISAAIPGLPEMSAATVDVASTPDSASSRRMRKRELDRRCQRMARERTKNRIAYLEGLVEEFRTRDSSGQIASLMNQLSDLSKERDLLAKTLQSIQNSIQTHRSLFEDAQPPTNTTAKTSHSPERTVEKAESAPDADHFSDAEDTASNAPSPPGLSPPKPEKPKSNGPPYAVSENGSSVQPTTPPSLPIDLDDNVPTYGYLEDDDPIVPRTTEECECHPASTLPGCKQNINMWRYANKVLTRPPVTSREINDLEDEVADDTPVRALIEGWESVERRHGGQLPPSWRKLRRIDEVIFGSCNVGERLAIMRIMHKLMRFHTDPTEERRGKVPPWYMQRPSQTIAHSYAIDYFAWPGLRERFVFYQHRYCGNMFWKLFCSSLRILWPFEFRDCYTRNLQTGQYHISPQFDERIGDINAWTMDSDIFKRWPEFYSDIPAYNHIPASVPAAVVQRTAVTQSNRNISDVTEEEAAAAVRNNDPFQAQMFDIWGSETPFLQMPPKGMGFVGQMNSVGGMNPYQDLNGMNNVMF